MAELKRLYDLSEAEKILTVSRRTLLNYIQRGSVKAVKLGGKWKISETELKRITNI